METLRDVISTDHLPVESGARPRPGDISCDMDEPTNHLGIEFIRWLEQFLLTCTGANDAMKTGQPNR